MNCVGLRHADDLIAVSFFHFEHLFLQHLISLNRHVVDECFHVLKHNELVKDISELPSASHLDL